MPSSSNNNAQKPFSIKDISKEIEDNSKYGFKRNDKNRDIVRKLTRLLHGYDINSDISARHISLNPTTDSPIVHIKKGGNIAIRARNNPQKTKYTTTVRNARRTPVLTKIEYDFPYEIVKIDDNYKQEDKDIILNFSNLQQEQREVEIYYDADKVTADQALRIQQIKCSKSPHHVRASRGMIFGNSYNEEEAIVESLASYVVVRGTTKQYFDEGIGWLNIPAERVSYFANFPRLQVGSKDFIEFCDSEGEITKKQELKQKFKDILLLQAMVANIHNEGFDVVTPNAFLSGLNSKNKTIAKKLFIEAALEVAETIKNRKDKDFGSFKGLFIHALGDEDKKNIRAEIEKRQIEDFIAVNTGNASAPGRIAMKKAGFKIADCAMGNALEPAGNGAPSDGANKAKEEKDAREMLGWFQLIFGPQHNPNLLDKSKYKAIKIGQIQAKTSAAHSDLASGGPTYLISADDEGDNRSKPDNPNPLINNAEADAPDTEHNKKQQETNDSHKWSSKLGTFLSMAATGIIFCGNLLWQAAKIIGNLVLLLIKSLIWGSSKLFNYAMGNIPENRVSEENKVVLQPNNRTQESQQQNNQEKGTSGKRSINKHQPDSGLNPDK